MAPSYHINSTHYDPQSKVLAPEASHRHYLDDGEGFTLQSSNDSGHDELVEEYSLVRVDDE